MRYAAYVALLTAASLGCYFVGSAGGQAPANSPPDKTLADLNVQYARVYRDLARLDYEKVLAANREVPGVISRDTLGTLEVSLIYADVRYQQAVDEASGKEIDRWSYLQTIANATEGQYQAALRTAHFSRPEYRLELDRLRLTAELARLRVEKAKDIMQLPQVDRLGWGLQLMHEELLLVSQKVSRLLAQPAR